MTATMPIAPAGPAPRRIADVLPCHTPDALHDLHGPKTGYVQVPSHVWTGPGMRFDVTDRRSRWALYSAVVRDGTPAEQASYLDRGLLVELWPDLNLPRRCRETWAARFPELAALPVRAMAV